MATKLGPLASMHDILCIDFGRWTSQLRGYTMMLGIWAPYSVHQNCTGKEVRIEMFVKSKFLGI